MVRVVSRALQLGSERKKRDNPICLPWAVSLQDESEKIPGLGLSTRHRFQSQPHPPISAPMHQQPQSYNRLLLLCWGGDAKERERQFSSQSLRLLVVGCAEKGLNLCLGYPMSNGGAGEAGTRSNQSPQIHGPSRLKGSTALMLFSIRFVSSCGGEHLGFAVVRPTSSKNTLTASNLPSALFL